VGGAHRAKEAAIVRTGDAIAKALADLKPLSAEELKKHRRQKFLSIGRNL
jgi:acetyl-CoA carboxylase carboxyl transferase subunit alpha